MPGFPAWAPDPARLWKSHGPLVISIQTAFTSPLSGSGTVLAEQLNTEGWRSGRGGSFTASKVQWVRYVHGIASGCPEGPAACPRSERGDGRCSAQVAAKALNVDVSTIAAWCKSACLDGIQVTPHGPWWIRLTLEDIPRLRKPIRRRWKKRSSK